MKRPWKDVSTCKKLAIEAAYENSDAGLRKFIIEIFHRNGQEYDVLLENLFAKLEELQGINGINYPPIQDEETPTKQGGYGLLPPLGLLKYMGYSVDKHGPNAIVRITLLKNIYTKKLLNAVSPAYMAGWGVPGSLLRRQKIIESIKANMGNMQNRFNSAYSEAIEKCRVDLKYFQDSPK